MNGRSRYDIARCLLICGVLMPAGAGFTETVEEAEAIAVADLQMRTEFDDPTARIGKTERIERLSMLQDPEVLYMVGETVLDKTSEEQEILAYVVKYQPGGFVVVSADDAFAPIIGFDIRSPFTWTSPDDNFVTHILARNLPARAAELRESLARGIDVDIHPCWSSIRSRLYEDQDAGQTGTGDAGRGSAHIYVLWDTALWGQESYYNDEVVARNGNIPDIPTGCTATAMAIQMHFHSWPLQGDSSHSYADNGGDVQFNHFVNYAETSYDWANMPMQDLTEPNDDVAQLMYHCGVAVEMDYEVGGSGAWPSVDAMHEFFRYKGTVERTSGHMESMKASILGGLPVILSTTVHTVVASGYREGNLPPECATCFFYLNIGGYGNNNGWWDIYNIYVISDDPSVDRSYPYSSPGNYMYVDSLFPPPLNFGTLPNPYRGVVMGAGLTPSGGRLLLKGGRSYTGSDNVPLLIEREMTIKTYDLGTAVIGDNLSLTEAGVIRAFSGGGLRIY